MPRGYRYVILAAFGWLSLAASPPQAAAQRNQPQSEQAIANALQSIDASLKKANETGEESKPCEPDKPNRNSDLCAQWKAADAASDSADWTRRTFWLSVGGFVAALLTLGAASAAAYFAWRAAEETRRGADAAERSLEHARDTVDVQVRPYVTPHYAKLISVRDGVWRASAPIINSGTIPARDVTVNIMVALVNVPIDRRSFDFPQSPMTFSHVVPNVENPKKAFTGIYLTEQDFDDIRMHNKVLICKVYVAYKPLPHLAEERSELEMLLTAPDLKRRKFRSVSQAYVAGGRTPEQTELDV